MTQLYSFDIFDTCLIRTCGQARNVFHILAEKILGKEASISAKNDFAAIRMNAAREATRQYTNNANEEITLEQIYGLCDFSSLTKTENSQIMQAEMDVEEAVLVPVEKMKNHINLLAKQGAKVIYISDMYLPKLFICKLLADRGFYVNDNVYLSSDIKKTKSSGHLYDYISEQLHIKNCQWLHTGDNILSDYKVPRRRHIKARLACHPYNRYESMGWNLMLDGTSPMSGYAFSLSKAMRLSFPDTPNYKFASTFIAPMFVPFVHKLLCESVERGINHLFFVARDGYILYQIAKEMAKKFPTVRLSYLYASRQALYMAGLSKLSPECVIEEMPHLKNKGVEGILYELHLPDYDYSKLPLAGLNGEQIIKTLFADEAFAAAVKRKYEEQNEYAVKYFEQEGLTQGNCAIVDAVGSRRCQKAINNILLRHHYPKTFAFYFEVTWCRITVLLQFS